MGTILVGRKVISAQVSGAQVVLETSTGPCSIDGVAVSLESLVGATILDVQTWGNTVLLLTDKGPVKLKAS